MSIIVRMPKSGYTMREGIIGKIHVEQGVAVKKDDIIMEYETDKISGEITAEADGTIIKLYAKEGETYEVLAPLCVIGVRGETFEGDDSPAEPVLREEIPASATIHKEQAPPLVETAVASMIDGRILATPYAKKLGKDNDIDLWGLAGTGPNGRIQKKDVLAASVALRIFASPLAKKIAGEQNLNLKNIIGTGPRGRIEKDDVLAALSADSSVEQVLSKITNLPTIRRREKLSSMRKVIANRLSQSKQTIPHVYFKSDVDATGLLEMKNRLAVASQKKLNRKISLNDIILLGTARALAEFDIFSAQLDGNEIIYADVVNLGFAVSLEKGLIVPVIRNAEKLSLSEAAVQASTLAEKARNGKLLPEDIEGATFTVSNLGALGIDEFTAIINPPESGILAVGTVSDKVVVIAGQIVIRPMLTLTLSVDHRIIDGAVAAAFLKRVKEILEDAYSLLL